MQICRTQKRANSRLSWTLKSTFYNFPDHTLISRPFQASENGVKFQNFPGVGTM